MKEKRSMELIKRLKLDAICSWIIAIVLSVVTISFFVRFLMLINTSNYDIKEIDDVISFFTRLFSITIAQIILSFMLRNIINTGRPFSSNNASKIRAIAIVLICSFPLEIILTLIGHGMCSTQNANLICINYEGIILMFIGTIIGIISEIFFYGKELEDEMDQIA